MKSCIVKSCRHTHRLIKVVRNSFPFSITTELYERLTRFVVKDYYYLLIADVAITFQLINSYTLTDILVVMAT